MSAAARRATAESDTARVTFRPACATRLGFYPALLVVGWILPLFFFFSSLCDWEATGGQENFFRGRLGGGFCLSLPGDFFLSGGLEC